MRRLRREGNKKSSISWTEESGDILQQPKISSTVFVLLSCGVIRALCKSFLSVPPDSKQTAILWPTSWVLQPSLSCAIWGIYSVTHHWESRGLPLYTKHYATIIMRKWDKWPAFLPKKCHKPLPPQMTWVGQGFRVLVLLLLCWKAKGRTLGSTW